jgi:hypothetical protein
METPDKFVVVRYPWEGGPFGLVSFYTLTVLALSDQLDIAGVYLLPDSYCPDGEIHVFGKS